MWPKVAIQLQLSHPIPIYIIRYQNNINSSILKLTYIKIFWTVGGIKEDILKIRPERSNLNIYKFGDARRCTERYLCEIFILECPAFYSVL